MVQELAVHEVPILVLSITLLFLEFLVVLVLGVFNQLNSVFSRRLVELSFHQNVEEQTNGSVISQTKVQIQSPEQIVAFFMRRVWETYEVNCHVANHSFIIKRFSNTLRNSNKVHLWKTHLRIEAPSVYVFFASEFIERTNHFNLATRINEESNRGTCRRTCITNRSCFNNPSDFAELSNKFFKCGKESILSNLNLFWEYFPQYFQ